MPAICWVCSSANVVLWRPRSVFHPLTPDDLRAPEGRYAVALSLWRCRACTFIFADAEELGELAALSERLADVTYEEAPDTRRRQMRWLLRKALAAHPTARTALDVGVGAGALLAEAAQAGLDAVGVEPRGAFVQRARAADAVDVVRGAFVHPSLAGRKFDVVFLVDVIEHVPEPVELLRASAGALAAGGVVLLVTPDVGSYFARKLRSRWWHFRMTHVGYFNHRSLAHAVARAGLRVGRQGRGVWYFRVGYLARRAAAYVPGLAAVDRLVRRLPPLRWLYDLVVRVNLRDSIFVVLRRADDLEPHAEPPPEPGHDPALL